MECLLDLEVFIVICTEGVKLGLTWTNRESGKAVNRTFPFILTIFTGIGRISLGGVGFPALFGVYKVVAVLTEVVGIVSLLMVHRCKGGIRRKISAQ